MIDLGTKRFTICPNCNHLLIYDNEDITTRNNLFVVTRYNYLDVPYRKFFSNPADAIELFNKLKDDIESINSNRKKDDKYSCPKIDIIKASNYLICPNCNKEINL